MGYEVGVKGIKGKEIVFNSVVKPQEDYSIPHLSLFNYNTIKIKKVFFELPENHKYYEKDETGDIYFCVEYKEGIKNYKDYLSFLSKNFKNNKKILNNIKKDIDFLINNKCEYFYYWDEAFTRMSVKTDTKHIKFILNSIKNKNEMLDKEHINMQYIDEDASYKLTCNFHKGIVDNLVFSIKREEDLKF